MAVQSAVSLAVGALVIARAVDILRTLSRVRRTESLCGLLRGLDPLPPGGLVELL